jgi:hypothetical protein
MTEGEGRDKRAHSTQLGNAALIHTRPNKMVLMRTTSVTTSRHQFLVLPMGMGHTFSTLLLSSSKYLTPPGACSYGARMDVWAHSAKRHQSTGKGASSRQEGRKMDTTRVNTSEEQARANALHAKSNARLTMLFTGG